MRKVFLLFLTILFILIFIIQSFCYGTYLTIPTWNENTGTTEVNANVADNFLNIEAESAILIEQNTGKVLYEKNANEQLRPASVTKIMSILLIMEALDSGKISLDTKISCSEKASSMGGSQIWLDETESLTVDEMLKAICVVSANDCVVAMAEHLAGSEEAFVEQMNNRAKELGMKNTVFKNCHGIDEDGHLSTSYDIALMSRELLKNHPSVTKYTTIWMDSLRDGKSELVNTNKLIRTYEGATGLKTGSTSLALYNLSASATRDNLSLIAVVMKAPSTKIRFSSAKTLLDYGFNTYKYEKLAEKGSILQSIEIAKSAEKQINLVFENDSGALLKKDSSNSLEQTVTINENITAPITKGDVLGKVTYSLDGETVSEVNLIAENDVEKINFESMLEIITKKWINLLR